MIGDLSPIAADNGATVTVTVTPETNSIAIVLSVGEQQKRIAAYFTPDAADAVALRLIGAAHESRERTENQDG